MRYSRNIKICRGGVDAAPFASLFFIVVLFTMLFYSHVFFPGVPIKLSGREGAPEMATRSAKVHASGLIDFLGTSYDLEGLKGELLGRAQQGTLPKRILIEAEPDADRRFIGQVENLLKGSGITLKQPGTRLELPDNAGFPGANNPVVVVGINLNGQVFFQHQLVSEAVLEQRLRAVLRRAREPLTVLLQADKNVPTEKIVALSEIASRVGFAELRIATKPPST